MPKKALKTIITTKTKATLNTTHEPRANVTWLYLSDLVLTCGPNLTELCGYRGGLTRLFCCISIFRLIPKIRPLRRRRQLRRNFMSNVAPPPKFLWLSQKCKFYQPAEYFSALTEIQSIVTFQTMLNL